MCVPVAAGPVLDELKALFQELRFAMLLPVGPGLGMAVEGVEQRADRVVEAPLDPRLGPAVPAQVYPSLEGGLSVGRPGVALLTAVSVEERVRVHALADIDRSRTRRHLLK